MRFYVKFVCEYYFLFYFIGYIMGEINESCNNCKLNPQKSQMFSQIDYVELKQICNAQIQNFDIF